MNEEILTINNLSVVYKTQGLETEAVTDVSLSLRRGERIGVVGESGSGKTTTMLAIMGLLDKTAQVSGKICFENTDLQELDDKDRNKYRWNRIAIVFQNSLDILNPVLTVYTQIAECIDCHMNITKEQTRERVKFLLGEVGLDYRWAEAYPSQLSGGMRQRVLLAMSIACEPDVLIVDEPTTALDAVAKEEIIALLDRMQKQKDLTLLVSSHEMSTIQKLTDKTIVMYHGKIVEVGNTEDVIFEPEHPYTRGLMGSSTQLNCFRDLWGIPQEDEHRATDGCPFYNRCNQFREACSNKNPELKAISSSRLVACNRGGIATVLDGQNIVKSYYTGNMTIEACRKVDIKIKAGEVVALIGESGSGKTTLANILCGMLEKDGGNVFYEGERIKGYAATQRKNGIQITFQDSFSSIDGNFSVYQTIEEPLRLLKLDEPEVRKEQVLRCLKDVQLPTEDGFLQKKCYMLSGGQRQRVAIARSLIMQPQLLIADEISSLLDPSTQANILRILKGLQNRKGFSMLYITHDLSLARKIADRVYIMKQGQIVENGSARKVFSNPENDYTKELLRCAEL